MKISGPGIRPSEHRRSGGQAGFSSDKKRTDYLIPPQLESKKKRKKGYNLLMI